MVSAEKHFFCRWDLLRCLLMHRGLFVLPCTLFRFCRFVKCVKSNKDKKPLIFEEDMHNRCGA